MTKTPQKYKNNRDSYVNSINSNLEKYKNTYVDYMNHVSVPENGNIDQHCQSQENDTSNECINLRAKNKIDENITKLRNDISQITSDLNDLGNSANRAREDFNKEEEEYAIEQNKLKDIKEKNAESIMMKKITEDNQAINIVESIYLVAGISFMAFFIWKQLNK